MGQGRQVRMVFDVLPALAAAVSAPILVPAAAQRRMPGTTTGISAGTGTATFVALPPADFCIVGATVCKLIPR